MYLHLLLDWLLIFFISFVFPGSALVPTNLTAILVGQDHITLMWDEPSVFPEGSLYSVSIRGNNSVNSVNSSFFVTQSRVVGDTNVTLGGLMPFSTYACSVRLLADEIETSSTEELFVRTLEGSELQ